MGNISKSKISIKSTGGINETTVAIDGLDVTGIVTSVSWGASAADGGLPHAAVEFFLAETIAETDLFLGDTNLREVVRSMGYKLVKL